MSDIPEVDHPVHGACASTITVMFIFGSIVFATVALAARTWLLGDNRGELLIQNYFLDYTEFIGITNVTKMFYYSQILF